MKRYILIFTKWNLYLVYDRETKCRSHPFSYMKRVLSMEDMFGATSDLNISEDRAISMANSTFEFDSVKEIIEEYPEEFI